MPAGVEMNIFRAIFDKLSWQQEPTKLPKISKALMYHGTSSKHLQSILSKGLLPNQTKNYGSERGLAPSQSYESFGGVYLASNFMVAHGTAERAASETSGRPLILSLLITMNTQNIILDEDLLYDILFEGSVRILSAFIKKSGHKTKRKSKIPGKIPLEELLTLAQGLKTRSIKLAPLVDKAYQNLIDYANEEDHPKLLKEVLDKKAEIRKNLENLYYSLALHLTSQHYYFWKKGLKGPKAKLIGLLKDDYRNMVQDTQVLAKSIRKLTEFTTKQYVRGMNISFPEPIVFRGKNRILAIVEVPLSGETDPSLKKPIFHYTDNSIGEKALTRGYSHLKRLFAVS